MSNAFGMGSLCLYVLLDREPLSHEPCVKSWSSTQGAVWRTEFIVEPLQGKVWLDVFCMVHLSYLIILEYCEREFWDSLPSDLFFLLILHEMRSIFHYMFSFSPSLFFLFCFVFWDGFLCLTALDAGSLLCRPGWPQTPENSPASASWVLELKVCATMPHLHFLLLICSVTEGHSWTDIYKILRKDKSFIFLQLFISNISHSQKSQTNSVP